MSSTLESEDLEHVQLVRMEDVQPSRERPSVKEEEIEFATVKDESLDRDDLDGYCIVYDLDYDNECVVVGNDEDSNIGSMVSIPSEEVVESNDSTELIVPEILGPKRVYEVDQKPKKLTIPGPESWPTLEILPGGVINHLETAEDDLTSPYPYSDSDVKAEYRDMMYACAKCPQRFHDLCRLVKHVRWHASGKKHNEDPSLSPPPVRKAPVPVLLQQVKKPASQTVLPKGVIKSSYMSQEMVKPVLLRTYKRKPTKMVPKKLKS